jgi:hypothetical protein
MSGGTPERQGHAPAPSGARASPRGESTRRVVRPRLLGSQTSAGAVHSRRLQCCVAPVAPRSAATSCSSPASPDITSLCHGTSASTSRARRHICCMLPAQRMGSCSPSHDAALSQHPSFAGEGPCQSRACGPLPATHAWCMWVARGRRSSPPHAAVFVSMAVALGGLALASAPRSTWSRIASSRSWCCWSRRRPGGCTFHWPRAGGHRRVRDDFLRPVQTSFESTDACTVAWGQHAELARLAQAGGWQLGCACRNVQIPPRSCAGPPHAQAPAEALPGGAGPTMHMMRGQLAVSCTSGGDAISSVCCHVSSGRLPYQRCACLARAGWSSSGVRSHVSSGRLRHPRCACVARAGPPTSAPSATAADAGRLEDSCPARAALFAAARIARMQGRLSHLVCRGHSPGAWRAPLASYIPDAPSPAPQAELGCWLAPPALLGTGGGSLCAAGRFSLPAVLECRRDHTCGSLGASRLVLATLTQWQQASAARCLQAHI